MSSSVLFQYSQTASSSVHSRTTTETGRSSRGLSAAATSPSVAAPSDAITSTHRLPVARSWGARSKMVCVADRMAAQSGVRPVGELSRSRRIRSISVAGAPVPHQIV
eukprot:scaffold29236_cov120-Isochrysis_galbana.AAC.3